MPQPNEKSVGGVQVCTDVLRYVCRWCTQVSAGVGGARPRNPGTSACLTLDCCSLRSSVGGLLTSYDHLPRKQTGVSATLCHAAVSSGPARALWAGPRWMSSHCHLVVSSGSAGACGPTQDGLSTPVTDCTRPGWNADSARVPVQNPALKCMSQCLTGHKNWPGPGASSPSLPYLLLHPLLGTIIQELLGRIWRLKMAGTSGLEAPSMCILSHSVVSDSAPPWTVACQAPLSMEFSRRE